MTHLNHSFSSLRTPSSLFLLVDAEGRGVQGSFLFLIVAGLGILIGCKNLTSLGSTSARAAEVSKELSFMELKLFDSRSAALAHKGRLYSTSVESWRDAVSVRVSRLFCSCRDSSVRAAWSSTSNNAHTASNAALSSSGQGVTESCLYRSSRMNGMNSSVCSRDLRVLNGYDDEYGGFVVDPDKIPANQNAFTLMLQSSLSHWKN